MSLAGSLQWLLLQCLLASLAGQATKTRKLATEGAEQQAVTATVVEERPHLGHCEGTLTCPECNSWDPYCTNCPTWANACSRYLGGGTTLSCIENWNCDDADAQYTCELWKEQGCTWVPNPSLPSGVIPSTPPVSFELLKPRCAGKFKATCTVKPSDSILVPLACEFLPDPPNAMFWCTTNDLKEICEFTDGTAKLWCSLLATQTSCASYPGCYWDSGERKGPASQISSETASAPEPSRIIMPVRRTRGSTGPVYSKLHPKIKPNVDALHPQNSYSE